MRSMRTGAARGQGPAPWLIVWAVLAPGATSGCGSSTSQWPGGIHARMAWSDAGLRVVDVPEGPARSAGLRPDDRIVAIDGVPVLGRPLEQVVAMLRGEVGLEVSLSVLRGGEPLTMSVTRAPYDDGGHR